MDIKARVSRIIGQMKGIEKMADKKRDCSDILQQVSAVKKAIDGLSKELVIKEICQYVPEKEVKKVERAVERAINL
jgi:DNA-binding FrmR family transcriptional regulator